MNRRQKIIVSVTGIFLVLLIIVGLTYAYFLTRINGNENTKSISVTTANLALVYGNDDGSVIGEGETIEPGTTFEPKTFTVTNQGNANTDYVVVIENTSVTYATTVEVDGVTHTAGETTTFESNDFVYTLTCESGCNGVSIPLTFPIEGGILIGNSIDVGETQTYSFTLTYNETGLDQSNDMNKKLEGKINIKDINDTSINPYSANKNTLAYNIINNAIGLTNEEKELGYATYATITPTKVAQEISRETESVLSTTQDEYGTSYYYRGDVENNYLNFNGMCWRIVRIEGDGSIKIVLADDEAGCSTATLSKTDSAYIGTGDYGYTTEDRADYENSAARTTSMKYKFNVWFNTNLASVSSKLKTTQVCIGDVTNTYTSAGVLMTEAEKQTAITNSSSFYYDSYIRLNGKGQTANATLICGANGVKTSKTQIFPLTADEVVFAGGKAGTVNYSYYLRENASSNYWWTLFPAYFDGDFGSDSAFYVNLDGDVSGYEVYTGGSLRPAISLIASTPFNSGDGSIENPYTIK